MVMKVSRTHSLWNLIDRLLLQSWLALDGEVLIYCQPNVIAATANHHFMPRCNMTSEYHLNSERGRFGRTDHVRVTTDAWPKAKLEDCSCTAIRRRSPPALFTDVIGRMANGKLS